MRTLATVLSAAMLSTVLGCSVQGIEDSESFPTASADASEAPRARTLPGSGESLRPGSRLASSDIVLRSFDAHAAATIQPSDAPAVNAANEMCPGELVAVSVGSQTIGGTTTGAADDFASWCGDTSAASDVGDAVYQLQIAEAGVLTIEATGQG